MGMTRLAELRALLAKATRDPESLTAKQHGPYSDVTIPGADLAALLDVAEEAEKYVLSRDSDTRRAMAPLRNALKKLSDVMVPNVIGDEK